MKLEYYNNKIAITFDRIVYIIYVPFQCQICSHILNRILTLLLIKPKCKSFKKITKRTYIKIELIFQKTTHPTNLK